MRLLTLHMENFGPYRDAAVDFTAFDRASVFLISGNTGSGKTTIFDAMVYALYGQTTGGERTGEEMRSKFAAPDAPTRVTLTFTHAGKTYRITREPRQLLAKKSGTGLTNRPASVALNVAVDGQETAEWTKERDVRPRIQDLLHLDADQFRQMVLLPQGQFRQFLDASSYDKAALLRHLFNTGLYGRWQDALRQRAKAASAKTAAQAAQLSATIAQFDWGELEAPESTLTADALAAMQAAVVTQDQAATTAEAAATAAQQQRDQAQAAQTAGETLAAAFTDRAQAQRQLDDLQHQAAAMADTTQRVTQLRWVQAHRDAAAGVTAAQARQADWQARLAAATAAKQPAAAALAEAQQQVAATQAQAPQLDAAKQQLAELGKVKENLTAVAKLKAAAAQAAAALTAAQEAEAAAQSKQAALATKLAANQQAQADLQAASHAAAYTAADRQLAAITPLAEQQAAASRQVTQLTAAEAAAVADETTAHQAASAAEQAYTTLHDASLQDQIAGLVAQLSPGQPCPVCGSLEHPAPHQAVATQPVSAAALQAADDARQHATKAAAAAAQKRAGLAAQLDAATATQATATNALTAALAAAKVSDVPTLKAQVATLKATVAAETKQAKQLTAAASALATEHQAASAAVATAADARMAADHAATAAQTAYTTKQASLPGTLPDLAAAEASEHDLTAKIHQLTTARDAAATALTAAQTQVTTVAADWRHAKAELAAATTAAAAAQTKFEVELTAFFGTADSAPFTELQAHLGELPDLAAQVTTYNEAVAAAKALLAKATATIGAAAAPDLPALQAAAAQAAEAATAALKAAVAARDRVLRNQDLVTKVTKLAAQNQAALAEAAAITNLAAVLAGDNPEKLSLERYVLRAYLDSVLSVANPRLHQLTGGRYQFSLHQEKGSHKNDTGLEIDVYDDQVGATRSVHTLSGGESFIAALCLALALGTVIQRESGGITIDALFVDEGFGSLDTASLNAALQALETIDGDRMIGIISHVTELRDGIADQLRVSTTGAGDSTLTVVHRGA